MHTTTSPTKCNDDEDSFHTASPDKTTFLGNDDFPIHDVDFAGNLILSPHVAEETKYENDSEDYDDDEDYDEIEVADDEDEDDDDNEDAEENDDDEDYDDNEVAEDNYEEEDIDNDDDSLQLKDAPKIVGNRALKSLLDAVDDDFFDSSNESTASPIRLRSPRRKGRPRVTEKKFKTKKPSPGAPQSEIEEYEKAKRKFYAEERLKKINSPNKRPITEYTGNHHPTLRTMTEVENSPLLKGQTFSTRAILLLRVKEEANLRGLGIKVVKSDVYRLIVASHQEPMFVVMAYQSMKKGYEVKVCLVREMDRDPDWDGVIPGCE